METLVLDEADEMLNMDSWKIMNRLSNKFQKPPNALFSATMPDDIKRIGVQFMKDPECSYQIK